MDERCDNNNSVLEENCALLCCYDASVGIFLRTFRFKISYPSSRIKNTNKKCLSLEDGFVIFSETSLRIYHY